MSNLMNEDTIAAISTGNVPAGIGIVRISGNDSAEIAQKLFYTRSGKDLRTQAPYTMHHGWVRDNGEDIDEALFLVMRAPHSYTGEDTVEINCHGGILAVQRVLEAVLKNGARAAEPGEFTKRAFLNGRLDLSEAEAVMDLISAKNEYARKSSLKQLKGGLSDKIRRIRQALIHETAHIEAAIDDPEHISLEDHKEEMAETIREQKEALEELLLTADSGKLIREGIRTVITGKPNAGKSSLLNRLTGEERAIVTDIAGTTRDIIEEQVNLNGIPLCVLDTAGIRSASDRIEQIGVDRAVRQIREADLVLAVLDASSPIDENDLQILRLVQDKPVIYLLNKSDKPAVITEEDLRGRIEEYRNEETGVQETKVLLFSARTGEGMDALEETIRALFLRNEINLNDKVYTTNLRHRKALSDAAESLRLVLNSIEDDMPEDFYSIDLMGACDALGRITGESSGEDLVNEIFSKFCMGK